MSDRMKVMTIVGTRPEIIKLSRTIHELDRYTDHVLVHTGQTYDYELNEIFFRELEIRRPDHFLEAAGATAAETIGNVIARADRVIEAEKPDALLLLGDTNSCISALAAKRRRVPVFHMEAGNRSFDERVPEEINRRVVDHLSDINLVYTEHARRYLLREGIRPETVLKTGSPMREVLSHYAERIDASDVLARLELEPERFIVVSAHREENVDSEANFAGLIGTLNALAERWGFPVIVSTHPRTRARMDKAGELGLDERVRLMKPLGFFDYVHLQRRAFCVVSDSGTITEESSLLGFPAVTIREAHERPEGMDVGTLVMCGLRPADVLRAVEVVTDQVRERGRRPATVPDYETETVSLKVLRVILSYTRYVNRTVWHA
ncbi:MAG TPA: UDP-N-acetylglucosamine 2-epimerase (non-hydrolyzing) [Longimicrobium sp.]|nr:UDP-N-acetylglucosamine 2-epimerase (non-hydrolyzing) [Longimicrobium sp.]